MGESSISPEYTCSSRWEEIPKLTGPQFGNESLYDTHKNRLISEC